MALFLSLTSTVLVAAFDVLEFVFLLFLFSFFNTGTSLPSVGVCWRRSNPPWSLNPNRPNMKGKCNYPDLFQINWTPPPINVEFFSSVWICCLFFCVQETMWTLSFSAGQSRHTWQRCIVVTWVDLNVQRLLCFWWRGETTAFTNPLFSETLKVNFIFFCEGNIIITCWAKGGIKQKFFVQTFLRFQKLQSKR